MVAPYWQMLETLRYHLNSNYLKSILYYYIIISKNFLNVSYFVLCDFFLLHGISWEDKNKCLFISASKPQQIRESHIGTVWGPLGLWVTCRILGEVWHTEYGGPQASCINENPTVAEKWLVKAAFLELQAKLTVASAGDTFSPQQSLSAFVALWGIPVNHSFLNPPTLESFMEFMSLKYSLISSRQCLCMIPTGIF